MSRNKKEKSSRPVFKYYANRKLYFMNESRYVTLSEVRDVVIACAGDFEIHGMEKGKLAMKLITLTEDKAIDTDILIRAVEHGGIGAYISKLETISGVPVKDNNQLNML